MYHLCCCSTWRYCVLAYAPAPPRTVCGISLGLAVCAIPLPPPHDPADADLFNTFQRSIVTLPGTSRPLGNPYVIFFQPIQADLPINQCLRAASLNMGVTSGQIPWRGNILVAKYSDFPFGDMISCANNDLPIIIRHISIYSPTEFVSYL